MPDPNERQKPQVSNEPVNVLQLVQGQSIMLKGNILAEVVDNPGDGYWIRVKSADGSSGEDLVFANEVIGLVQ
jgi:hypothetical protein